MKILVVDDNPVHQASAQQTLIGHDLTVVGTYDEAMKVMDLHFSEGRKEEFDVVLTDLMMPASMAGLGGNGKKFNGQEMPMGFGLALLAVLYSGAKLIGVVTDMDRHAHPASRQLEMLVDADEHGRHTGKPSFVMNGVTVGFFVSSHSRFSVTVTDTETRGKDWGKVLAALLEK